MERLKHQLERDMQEVRTREASILDRLSNFNALTTKHELDLYLDTYDALHLAELVLSTAEGMDDPLAGYEERPEEEVRAERASRLERVEEELKKLERVKRSEPFIPSSTFARIDKFWTIAWAIFYSKKYPPMYPEGAKYATSELKSELKAIVSEIRTRLGVEINDVSRAAPREIAA